MTKKINTEKNLPKGCKECELGVIQKITIDLKRNLKRVKKIRIALVGQPNSGKSTFFNSLSVHKVNTANYYGTTVEYHVTTIFIKNYEIELIDLPGIYSLNYSDLAEKVTFEIITNVREEFKIDGIIQIVEAVSLPHALLLTLDLLTLDIPMVIALNMFDEARIKGVEIDIKLLENFLGIPVIPTVAIKGENTLKCILKLIAILDKSDYLESSDTTSFGGFIKEGNDLFYRASFSKEELPKVVEAYKKLWKSMVKEIFDATNCHFEKCKLVPACLMNIEKYAPNLISLANVRDEILKLKSNIIMSISSYVFSTSRPKPTFEDIIDKFVLHRFWGYSILVMVLFCAFYLAYFIGNFIADKIDIVTDPISDMVDQWAKSYGLLAPLITGFKDGLLGGIGIVIPYLVPFLLFISILEDSGYIPRMMYLIDGLLRPLGISGRSVLSFVLGLGCNVSAIMSLRGLTKYNERILAGIVIPFVPCSARTVVIMALVTGTLGVLWGLSLYLFSLIVIVGVLFLINKLSRFSLHHFMIHIPPYRIPSIKLVGMKIWLRFRTFVFTAWPILILGTIILNYLSYFQLDKHINNIFSFVTVSLLGLPKETGIPLIFGLLAKEYALVMLYSALGTENIKSIMNDLQIFVFSIFILLYTPCISTIAVQVREIGLKFAVISILLSVSTALLSSFIASRMLSFIL
ncbi:MAG: ferrous iron transport protein B [Candidatus Calescibacterium sp.]|nr:ferrous iron transport protein B [Candidatus Calescibacterium sp.]MDW8195890.1 ferrous iron transport protein B [Candidatus Calescibacterium sp.]